MDASVIIPTYHSWKQLQACLDCLAQQSVGDDRFEILVVNNDPSDPVPANLELPANARILSEGKPGSYAARNAGIRAARSDLLFFTDSDCLPEPGYVLGGLETAKAHPELGRFGGDVILIPNGPSWTVAELYDLHLGLGQQKWVEKGVAVTANLIVHRAVLDRVGLFNDTVFSGGDMEWNKRATQAGEQIMFAPTAAVRHPARGSLRAHIAKARRIEGARLRRNSKRGPINYIPPIHKLIPSFKTLRILWAKEDLSRKQVFSVWGVDYLLRLAKISETVRLLWLRQPDQRM